MLTRSLALAVALCVTVFIAQTLANPDDYYYCGTNPERPTPFFPPANASGVTLQQVSIVIRHGDRTTFGWYPNPDVYGAMQCWPGDTNKWSCEANPETIAGTDRKSTSRTPPDRLYRKIYDDNDNVLAGTCTTGQLTLKGYKQHIANGNMLRNYYVDKLQFLPKALNNATLPLFYIRSTDVPRTILSAEALFSGLYPFDTQPETLLLDIHTRSNEMENLVPNSNICPSLAQLHKEAQNSASYHNVLNHQVTPLMNQLALIIGTNLTFSSFNSLWDCSNAYYCHDFKLPSGLTLPLISMASAASTSLYNIMNTYPNATFNAQRSIGFFLKDMYQPMKNIVSKVQAPKFNLYSGHDTSLLPILSAYGLTATQWVPYASVLAFELYSTRSTSGTPFAVRMVYNQKEMIIPGCDDVLCSWDIFSSITENLFPTNYKEICAPY